MVVFFASIHHCSLAPSIWRRLLMQQPRGVALHREVKGERIDSHGLNGEKAAMPADAMMAMQRPDVFHAVTLMPPSNFATSPIARTGL